MVIPFRPPPGVTPEGRYPRGRDTSIYVGMVKKNDDVQKMGRLSVWIPEFGGDPGDPRYWINVSYASPFAGVTDPKNLVQDSKTLDGTQQSYGFWMVPPDLDNQVLVCFINGEMSRGFWFACLYAQNMNHMVPGIPVNKSFSDDPNRPSLPPVAEYNKKLNQNPDDPLRATYTPLDEGLTKQGLYSDSERGPASTGARRESPSKVFGFLTPRGNTLHVDDNTANEFIRLRTRGGTQVLVHETSGYVYINSKMGNSWIEVSDSGVDIYSNGAISLRSEGDLNLRADKNVNIDAGAAIHLRSGSDTTLASGRFFHATAASAIRLQSQLGLAILAKQLIVKGEGIGLEASDNILLKAGGANIRQGATIQDNPDADLPITNPGDATTATPGSQTTTTGAAGNYGTGAMQTIVSRLPSHEPWSGHPGQRGGGAGGTGPASQSAPGRAQTTGSGTTETVLTPGSSPPVPVGKGTAPEAVKAAICKAAKESGVPASVLFGLAYVESKFQNVPNRSAKPSSAKGVFQFINDTWKSEAAIYAKRNPNARRFTPDDVWDVEANALLGAQYTATNIAALKAMGIAEPNATDLYMCHLMGTAGGKKFLRARAEDPNTPVNTIVSDATAKNNGIGGMTVDQAYQRFGAQIARGGDFSNACTAAPETPPGTTPSVPTEAPATTPVRSPATVVAPPAADPTAI